MRLLDRRRARRQLETIAKTTRLQIVLGDAEGRAAEVYNTTIHDLLLVAPYICGAGERHSMLTLRQNPPPPLPHAVDIIIARAPHSGTPGLAAVTANALESLEGGAWPR